MIIFIIYLQIAPKAQTTTKCSIIFSKMPSENVKMMLIDFVVYVVNLFNFEIELKKKLCETYEA